MINARPFLDVFTYPLSVVKRYITPPGVLCVVHIKESTLFARFLLFRQNVSKVNE